MLIVEVVLTALLVFTVLAATDRIANVAFAGIPIGLVLTLIHLVGIPVDNLSVNPARCIGPAVFVGDWALGQLWLFIVAPLVGGVVRRRPPPLPVRGADADRARGVRRGGGAGPPRGLTRGRRHDGRQHAPRSPVEHGRSLCIPVSRGAQRPEGRFLVPDRI